MSNLLLSSVQKALIRRPERSVDSLQPARKPTPRSLCVDVWTRASNQVNTQLSSDVKERLPCKDAFSSVLARLSFKQGPIDID